MCKKFCILFKVDYKGKIKYPLYVVTIFLMSCLQHKRNVPLGRNDKARCKGSISDKIETTEMFSKMAGNDFFLFRVWCNFCPFFRFRWFLPANPICFQSLVLSICKSPVCFICVLCYPLYVVLNTCNILMYIAPLCYLCIDYVQCILVYYRCMCYAISCVLVYHLCSAFVLSGVFLSSVQCIALLSSSVFLCIAVLLSVVFSSKTNFSK